MPTRDRTPPRSVSPSSQVDSEVSDYSPLLKAERELFKLRDMMRQAVSIHPSATTPPQPKLQKKFYGSERPAGKDDDGPDLGSSRGHKEKGSSSSGATTQKSKSAQAQSKSDKSDKSASRKSGKSGERGSKSREKSLSREQERRERTNEHRDRQNDRERQNDKEKRDNSPLRNGQQHNHSSTRFDIDINENKKSVSITPRKQKESKKFRDMEDGNEQTQDGDSSRRPAQNGAREGKCNKT